MSKWELVFHENYGLGIITRNVLKSKKFITVNFKNDEIDNRVVSKDEIKAVSWQEFKNQQYHIESLF